MKISKLQSKFLFVAKPAVVWIVYIIYFLYAVTQRIGQLANLYTYPVIRLQKKVAMDDLVLGLGYLD